jgi:hypothetical protein
MDDSKDKKHANHGQQDNKTNTNHQEMTFKRIVKVGS